MDLTPQMVELLDKHDELVREYEQDPEIGLPRQWADLPELPRKARTGDVEAMKQVTSHAMVGPYDRLAKRVRIELRSI